MNNNFFIWYLLRIISVALILVSAQVVSGTNVADPKAPVPVAEQPASNTTTTETPATETPQSLPIDLVDERPSTIGAVVGYSTQAVSWVWNGFYNNVLYWVSPPSPGSLIDSVSEKDAIKLFKLLGYAGYKLKVVDTDIGIIPGLKIKFGQVKELSDADMEFLDSQLEEWEQEPGIYDALQRSIIKSVLRVNASGDYRVISLELKLLPLPDVAFTMIPKKIFLGEEASNLMMAIQRVERGVRGIKGGSP
jgi:hypothetical protein